MMTASQRVPVLGVHDPAAVDVESERLQLSGAESGSCAQVKCRRDAARRIG